jgi:hypothetical protein
LAPKRPVTFIARVATLRKNNSDIYYLSLFFHTSLLDQE